MPFLALLLILIAAFAIARMAYQKGQQSVQPGRPSQHPAPSSATRALVLSEPPVWEASFKMLAHDVADLHTHIKTHQEQAAHIKLQSEQSLAHINDLISSHAQLADDADSVLDKARATSLHCFDIVNQFAKVKDSFTLIEQQTQRTVDQIQTLSSPAIRDPLDLLHRLLLEQGQQQGEQASELSALENETHVVQHDVARLIQSSHKNQRTAWELLASVEGMTQQTLNAVDAMEHYSQTVQRAHDLIATIDQLLKQATASNDPSKPSNHHD